MGTPFAAAGRRGARPPATRFALLLAITMAVTPAAFSVVGLVGVVGASSAAAQSATDPEAPSADEPTVTDPSPTPDSLATGASTATTATAVASGPTTTLPCVVGVPPGYVEFVGIAGRPSQTTVQFVVTQPITGAVERGPLVITLPDHAHFIHATKSYMVRAWMSDGRLVTYLTTNDCGRPRTTLADGTAVETALLGPLIGKTALVALGAFATLATIALLIYLLGRIRVYGPERARIVSDPRYRDAFRPHRQRRHSTTHR